MKVVGYMALHYGLEYMAYAIRSVIDQVDEFWILYTPFGSHGHTSGVRCPESMNDLAQVAYKAGNGKIRWCNGRWKHEGEQRDYIHHLAPDADLILVVDADEVWADGAAEYAIHLAMTNESRRYRIPMIHFWRSFKRAVLFDPAYPIRVINQNNADGEATLHVSPICHFGYAQSPALVAYKWQIHGHKNELRKDCDWFADKFMANAQDDCHPVGSEYWYPELVNPAVYLPDFMREHPNWGKDVIE